MLTARGRSFGRYAVLEDYAGYSDGEVCSIDVRKGGHALVTRFLTEPSADQLFINNKPYSGTQVPLDGACSA